MVVCCVGFEAGGCAALCGMLCGVLWCGWQDGLSPIMAAVRGSHDLCVKALVAGGVDVNTVTVVSVCAVVPGRVCRIHLCL